MTLNLMYITNNPTIAEIADKNGVDWIFIDLEIKGKTERQGHLDTVISKHSTSDIEKVKKKLKKSKLLVRTNPIHEGSKNEINECIKSGADILMLPYFKYSSEISEFIKIVGGRTEICLLLETPEAVTNLHSYIDKDEIDYIHIGLNDLHLGYQKKFMFELLIDNTVEDLATEFRKSNVKFGFGGIAKLGGGMIPAEDIITEHYRLGSSMVILSRSFYKFDLNDSYEHIDEVFNVEVGKVRELEKELRIKEREFFEENRVQLQKKIQRTIDTM